MKPLIPSSPEKWEDIAISTNVGAFLSALDMQVQKLSNEIESIYPELGRQAYRFKDRAESKPPWAVEQYLVDIANKDAEIARLQELRDSIIGEPRKMEPPK